MLMLFLTAQFETTFNTNGKLVVVVGDILETKCDVVANSIGPKENETSTFIPIGLLEDQFAKKGGPELVKELESAQHGSWGYGDIIFTPSHDIDQGDGFPQDICHFCVPRAFEGEPTLCVSMA